MSDPLSVAASIFGVTVPALHGVRLLLDDLSNIIDAPQSVENLKGDVALAERALQSLQTIKDLEWEVLGETITDQLKAAIKNCKTVCDSVRGHLQHWTKHSKEGRLSWKDRVTVGFFKERQIKAMSEQLQSCKIAFNSAVAMATLYSSVHHSHMTEEIRETISTKEAEIFEAITSMDTKLDEVESALEKIHLTDSTQERGQNEEDVTNLVKQIKEERAALDCSRKLLEELLLKAREDAIAKATGEEQNQSTKITFGKYNRGVQTGIIYGSISGITFGECKNQIGMPPK